jgi:hypothetical protein
VAEERVEVELLDPSDQVAGRGTARVRRDGVSREMTAVDDHRDSSGRPWGRPPGYRFVLKLSTGETPQVNVP